MFSPWSTVLLLALESSEVIAGGGVDARHEAHLIVSEKVDAVLTAVASTQMSVATCMFLPGPET